MLNLENETDISFIFLNMFLRLWHRQNLVVSCLLLLAVLIATYYVEGAHQQVSSSATASVLP